MSAGAGEFRLDGKAAVVTGGGSGIGRAIAMKFAACGAVVRILDMNRCGAANVAKGIACAGGTASVHVCDVTDQPAVVRTFEEIRNQGPLDVLVNNAGVSHVGSVESTSEAEFDRVLSVNVKGYV